MLVAVSMCTRIWYRQLHVWKKRELNYKHDKMRASETLMSHFDHFISETLFMVICRADTLQKTDGLLLIILRCAFLFAPLFVVVAALLWFGSVCFGLPGFALFTNLLITIRWNVCLRARSHTHVYELIVSTLDFGHTSRALPLLHFCVYCFTKRNTHSFPQRHSPLRSATCFIHSLIRTFLSNVGGAIYFELLSVYVLPSLVNKKCSFFF